MINETIEPHVLQVVVNQPTKNATYAEKLKYLIKVIDPDFPSYDFILRLASFATCSKLSQEQQKKADEFIEYFEKLGYFNQILYLEDEKTYNMVYDFCKEHNLKRVKIENFILDMYDINWGFQAYEANGLKDWKEEIIKANQKKIEDGLRIFKKYPFEDENTKKMYKTMLKTMFYGDIMQKQDKDQDE